MQVYSGIVWATCQGKQVQHISSHPSDARWVNVRSRLDNEVFVMLAEAKALKKREKKVDLFFKSNYLTWSDANLNSLVSDGKEDRIYHMFIDCAVTFYSALNC